MVSASVVAVCCGVLQMCLSSGSEERDLPSQVVDCLGVSSDLVLWMMRPFDSMSFFLWWKKFWSWIGSVESERISST